VGDPDGYTQMTNVPEFLVEGVDNVQGGTFPARIWGLYSTAALATLPVEDWPAPPELARKAVRLYLPGEECAYRVVAGAMPSGGTTTTVEAAPPPPVDPAAPVDPNAPTTVAATVPPVVIQLVPDQTTIAPSQLDPKAPLPSVDSKTTVLSCAKLPAGVIVSKPRT
jgi:hypothetical protein